MAQLALRIIDLAVSHIAPHRSFLTGRKPNMRPGLVLHSCKNNAIHHGTSKSSTRRTRYPPLHPDCPNCPQGEQGINVSGIGTAIANYILRTTAFCFYTKSKLTELIETSQLWQTVRPIQVERYQMCLV